MENTNETNNVAENQNTKKPDENFNDGPSNEAETPSGIRGGGTSPTTFNKETSIEINSAGDVASLNSDENFANDSQPEDQHNDSSTPNRDEYKDPNI